MVIKPQSPKAKNILFQSIFFLLVVSDTILCLWTNFTVRNVAKRPNTKDMSIRNKNKLLPTILDIPATSEGKVSPPRDLTIITPSRGMDPKSCQPINMIKTPTRYRQDSWFPLNPCSIYIYSQLNYFPNSQFFHRILCHFSLLADIRNYWYINLLYPIPGAKGYLRYRSIGLWH